MTSIETLVDALHADPSDGLACLAIADALEEAGDVRRAELTRLHATLGGMSEKERAEAEARVRELLADGVMPVVPEHTNRIGMRLAVIPPGVFLMGSPEGEEGRYDDERQHPVAITRPFYLGVHTVTQVQYEAVMGSNPSRFQGNPNRPVETVSWHDATAFCAKLTEMDSGGLVYRLPTEAEWEYACRGGLATGRFHYGDTLTAKHANFQESGLQRTCAVGSYPPNAFGLYDMHGNVWEWCQDWYGPYPVEAEGSTEEEEGTGRVIRGGGWSLGSRVCRSADRSGDGPALRGSDLGFRVAADPVGPMEGTGRVFRGGCWVNGSRNCRSAVRYEYDPTLRVNGLGFRVAADPIETMKGKA